MWCFSRLVRLLSKDDYRLFQGLYRLVYKTSAQDSDIHELFNHLAMEEKKQRLLATLIADDYTASELNQEEAAAFGSNSNESDNLAVARKLTVVTEINKKFVTTSKLRRWIKRALESDNVE